ncbi:recombinase family protein [Lihuaxuella thermophila]|uniref:Site-specific DNA recombinase n=1 Tax=Lihuaxuella thermophila TaxID=1173111 RepID=A0A1H8H980_9BACL|nr:recombinase family protein [Lihuaxuella thermophila]SEN52891.1 Site-specific DNA recombinase [Lihuaxuella thermophila]
MNRPTGLDCFIYLRKSRKDVEEERKAQNEGREFDTLERHRLQLLEVARRENHHIVEIFEEVVSGEYIIDRPEIQRMLREVEQGAVDAILVMDLDRLGRGDMFDMGSIFRVLQYSETLIITPTEVIDPNAEGSELIFGVKSILSREELKAINKRMQRGRRASAKEGKSISKKPPYGYLRDENLKLYPDPETAWVVKLIFERMAEGAGRIQIARELDAMGIKSPSGDDYWRASTISEIVKNEVYLGHIIWGKIKYIKRNGKYIRKKMPPEQWTRHNNAHEPLVSEELFRKANLAHSGRWRPPTRPTKPLSNPLAGVLFCALCGHAMMKFYYPHKRDQLRCVQTSCKGKQKGAVLELVEQRILEGLEQIVATFEADESKVKKQKTTSVIPFKLAQLKQKEKELEELFEQKNNLHELLEKKVYTIEVFMERQQIVSDRIKTTQEQIDQLKEEIKREEEKEKKQNEFVPRIKNVLAAYRATDDIEKKNRLLKSVLEKATYYRDINWKQIDHFNIELFPRL